MAFEAEVRASFAAIGGLTMLGVGNVRMVRRQN